MVARLLVLSQTIMVDLAHPQNSVLVVIFSQRVYQMVQTPCVIQDIKMEVGAGRQEPAQTSHGLPMLVQNSAFLVSRH